MTSRACYGGVPMVTRVAPQPNPAIAFNAVKVFAATMFRDRDQLGERVSAWLAANPTFDVADIVVTQSSDARFHCISISVFYWESLSRS